MRLSLRNRFFLWLLALNTALYAMIFAVFVAYEVYEVRIRGDLIHEELPEILGALFILMGTVPAMVLISWVVAGCLLDPLNRVLETADRIRRGRLEERVPAMHELEELARLADTLNDAFDRYDAAMRRHAHFSADASHQLRTPVAAIRAAAQVAVQQPRAPAEYRETLGEILDQAERLQRLIEHLLLLSRLDESLREQFTPLAFARECRRWTEEVGLALDGYCILYHAEPDAETLHIAGNPLILREVFDNLLNNAVAVSPTNGRIRISFQGNEQTGLEWRFEDEGPGVPPAERARVFDRFFRGTSAIGAGCGLGLSIVQEILRLHGATIRVEESSDLGGAMFCIRFPVSDSIRDDWYGIAMSRAI